MPIIIIIFFFFNLLLQSNADYPNYNNLIIRTIRARIAH